MCVLHRRKFNSTRSLTEIRVALFGISPSYFLTTKLIHTTAMTEQQVSCLLPFIALIRGPYLARMSKHFSFSPPEIQYFREQSQHHVRIKDKNVFLLEDLPLLTSNLPFSISVPQSKGETSEENSLNLPFTRLMSAIYIISVSNRNKMKTRGIVIDSTVKKGSEQGWGRFLRLFVLICPSRVHQATALTKYEIYQINILQLSKDSNLTISYDF